MSKKPYRTLTFKQATKNCIHVYAEDSVDGEYLVGAIETGLSEWYFDPQVDGKNTYADYSAADLIQILSKINELNGAK